MSDTRFVIELPHEEWAEIVSRCAERCETWEDFHRAINSRVCDIEDLLKEETC